MDRYVGEQGWIIVIRRAGSAVVCCLHAVDVERGRYCFSSLQSFLSTMNMNVNMLQHRDVFCMRLRTEGGECVFFKHMCVMCVNLVSF